MKIRPIRLVYALAATSLALTACGGSADIGDAVPVRDSSIVSSLDGDWQLVTGDHDGESLPDVAQTDITLSINGTELNGFAACNSYFGPVTLDDGSFVPGPMGATKMACEPAAMDAEFAYLTALAGVDASAVDGDQLTLSGASTNLVFQRVS